MQRDRAEMRRQEERAMETRKFCIEEEKLYIKRELYAVLEMADQKDWLYVLNLMDRDKEKSVHLLRESVRGRDLCTASCPHCKEPIFMKYWSERESWVLRGFCGSCGQRLSWENLTREDWTAV